MEWKQEIPTEPGYYWLSRNPGLTQAIVYVGGDIWQFNDSKPLEERNLRNAWFLGPITPSQAFPDRRALVQELDNLTNQLNTLIRNAHSMGLRVSWHVVQTGLEDSHEIDCQPHFDFKVFKEVSR